MNKDTHTPLIVICITVITIVFGVLGAWLIVKGYQSGEMLTTIAGSGLGGLCGFLGGKQLAASIPGGNPNNINTPA